MNEETKKAPKAELPDMIPVTSSNIEAVGYNEETQQLYISFHGGRTYRYDDVEKRIFEDLKAAGSVGSFFHKHIKNGGFKYTQIL